MNSFLSRFTNDPRWGYMLINFSALIWATNFFLGRSLRDEIGPVMLTTIRFVVAGLLFALILWRRPAGEKRPGQQWLVLLGMGFTGIFAFSSLLYTGLQTTTATNAALIIGASPLVITLMAVFMLGERPRRQFWLGIVVSMVGLVVVVSRGEILALLQLQLNIGDLLILLAVVAWGLYSVWGQGVMRERSAISTTALSTWFGLLFLFPVAGWEATQTPTNWTPFVILATLYIGLFPAFLAYLSWNEGVRLIGPARASVFYNLSPVYVALLSGPILGEWPTVPQIIGGVLVVGGTLVSVWNELFQKQT